MPTVCSPAGPPSTCLLSPHLLSVVLALHLFAFLLPQLSQGQGPEFLYLTCMSSTRILVCGGEGPMVWYLIRWASLPTTIPLSVVSSASSNTSPSLPLYQKIHAHNPTRRREARVSCAWPGRPLLSLQLSPGSVLSEPRHGYLPGALDLKMTLEDKLGDCASWMALGDLLCAGAGWECTQ